MTVVIVVHLDVMLVWDYIDSTLFMKKWDFFKKFFKDPPRYYGSCTNLQSVLG
jgi:hypothetical protein